MGRSNEDLPFIHPQDFSGVYERHGGLSFGDLPAASPMHLKPIVIPTRAETLIEPTKSKNYDKSINRASGVGNQHLNEPIYRNKEALSHQTRDATRSPSHIDLANTAE
jgi:hypothetical protein